MSRSTYAFALLAVAAAMAIAGCGGNDGSTGSSGGGYGSAGGSTESSSASAAGTAETGSEAASGGGAYASPAGSAPSGETAAAGGKAAVVSLASVGDLGKVLVDPKGFTLYNFHKDKGTTSNCNGECAKAWPPLLTTGAPEVGNGATASELGTTERSDGTTQVTYAGHPLYTFVGDKKPGEANGNDVSAFGAEWYALEGNGQEPEDS